MHAEQSEQSAGFDRACFLAPDQQVFITPAWSLRLSGGSAIAPKYNSAKSSSNQSPQCAELFVKPDDCFEINEVSNRCPEIVENMRDAMAQFIKACQTGEPAVLPPLPNDLTSDSE
jgi:hypothetical protein